MTRERKRTPQRRVATIMRLAREKKGLTQGAIAKEVGVTQKTVSAWENRRQPIPAERREALARLLDVPADRLDAEPKLR